MMPTNTYVALKTTTVTGSATSTIDFTSIPTTYTDLVVVTSAKNLSADNAIFMTFNGDSNANYSNTIMFGSGSSAGSGRGSSQNYCVIGRTNTAEFCVGVTHIQNYASSTSNRTILSRGGNAGNYVLAYVNLWRNSTDPINRITLTSGSGNFEVGSSATIYGVANSNIGVTKAFGGTITQDATYTYHAFGASGTFTPTQSLTADILVIGGGGGGGRIVAGGGGAGGLLGFSSQSLTATPYTVTVGSGGAGASASGYAAGTTGGDSSFGALTLVKGGGGGGHINNNGLNGGSGGGAGGAISGATQTGGSPTSGQGFAGGTATGNTSQYIGAGGGGAGGAGGANTSSTPGVGGIGVSTYSDWGLATGTGQNVAGTIYYAGGGAGGWSSPNGSVVNIAYGGLGGGGNGGWSRTNDSQDNPATVGLANTGGGGGGAGNDASGANANSYGKNGGSGLVIIRYAN